MVQCVGFVDGFGNEKSVFADLPTLAELLVSLESLGFERNNICAGLWLGASVVSVLHIMFSCIVQVMKLKERKEIVEHTS